MLQVDGLVQLEAVLDLAHLSRLCNEDVVHIVTGIQMTGIVGKTSPTELLNFVELGALRFHLLGHCTDEVVDAVIIPLGVQNNQAFVFPAHVSLLVFLWN